jgi:hypothetical protein
MKTAEQCIDKAIELEALAALCSDMDAYEYNQMAVQWRALARQAAWQEGFPHLSGPGIIH